MVKDISLRVLMSSKAEEKRIQEVVLEKIIDETVKGKDRERRMAKFDKVIEMVESVNRLQDGDTMGWFWNIDV